MLNHITSIPRSAFHKWEALHGDLLGFGSPSLRRDALTAGICSMGEREPAIYLDVPIQTESIRKVRDLAEAAALEAGFTDEDASDIKLAVGEAMNNAVRYSQPANATATDFVRVWLLPSQGPDGGGLAITVVNPGRFTPSESPLGVMPNPHDMTECGRGLALMSLLMDGISVREWNGQTIVRLWKQLPSAPAGEATNR